MRPALRRLLPAAAAVVTLTVPPTPAAAAARANPVITYTSTQARTGAYAGDVAVDSRNHLVHLLGSTVAQGPSVTVFDPARRAVVRSYGVSGSGLAVDDVSHLVYVVSGATVKVLDPSRKGIAATIALPSSGGRVTVDSGRHRVYVTLPGASAIAVLDRVAGTVTSVAVPGGADGGVGVDPTLDRVFVAGAAKGVITALSGSPLRRTASVAFAGANAIAVDPTIATMVVGSTATGNVAVVRTATLAYRTLGFLDARSSTFAVDTGLHLAYFAVDSSFNGTAIDLRRSATTVRFAGVVNGPVAAAADSSTHAVYWAQGGVPSGPPTDNVSITTATVSKGISSTTLDAPATSAPDRPFVVTATVGTDVDLGAVAFLGSNGGDPLPGCAAVPVVSGQARCTVEPSTAPQTSGRIHVRAVYSGSELYTPSEAFSTTVIAAT